MIESEFVRRALTAATALFLVAGVLAAAVVGGGDGEDGATVATRDSATTTAPTLDGGDVTAPPANAPQATDGTAPAASGNQSTATTASGGSNGGSASAPASTAPPTTAASSGGTAQGFADLGPASSGGTAAAPRGGLYRYSYKSPEREGEVSVRVEDQGESDGVRKQAVTISSPEFTYKNDMTWSASEVRVLKSTFTFGDTQAECDWNPDILQMKLPLSKGTSWESSTSCSMSGFGPTPIVIKSTTTAKVTDARRVRVAGEEIDVWVITGTERRESPQGVSETTSTTWFSGAHGLQVRQVTKSADGELQTEIKGLQPE